MNLDTLLQIASAAQVRDEYWSENTALFDRTFSSPRLIEKMLAEVIAARMLIDSFHVNSSTSQLGLNIGFIKPFEGAREALDAECSGTVINYGTTPSPKERENE